ncbi:UNVERIFIED_ORG: transcriptional regulator GlxA family with amidase domain [Pantoea agglomerans]
MNSSIMIVFLVCDEVNMLDLSGSMQVFKTANLLRDKCNNVHYNVKVLSLSGGLIKCSSGVFLSTESFINFEETIDTLIVVGGHGVENMVMPLIG